MKEKGEQFPQASVTVSRVLSRVDHLSRPGVAAQARAILRTLRAAACVLLRILHRMGFTARTSRQAAGELLPRLSILTGILSTFQPRLADDQREQDPCGLFLLHSPWSRLHRPLAGILPCGARTFLMPFGTRSPCHLAEFIVPRKQGKVKAEGEKSPIYRIRYSAPSRWTIR